MMKLWRLMPVARPDDPRWPGRRWAEVVVRAETPALAIAVAAEALRQPDPAGGHDPDIWRTGLEDEKLYAVREVTAREAGLDEGHCNGPPALLVAREG